MRCNEYFTVILANADTAIPTDLVISLGSFYSSFDQYYFPFFFFIDIINHSFFLSFSVRQDFSSNSNH